MDLEDLLNWLFPSKPEENTRVYYNNANVQENKNNQNKQNNNNSTSGKNESTKLTNNETKTSTKNDNNNPIKKETKTPASNESKNPPKNESTNSVEDDYSNMIIYEQLDNDPYNSMNDTVSASEVNTYNSNIIEQDSTRSFGISNNNDIMLNSGSISSADSNNSSEESLPMVGIISIITGIIAVFALTAFIFVHKKKFFSKEAKINKAKSIMDTYRNLQVPQPSITNTYNSSESANNSYSYNNNSFNINVYPNYRNNYSN